MVQQRVSGRLVAVLAVLLLVATALPLLITQSQAQARKPADKIEAGLLDQLSAAGAGDLVVRFGRQADLSPAYNMGWKERGEFVYNSLTDVAAESQAQAKAYLDERGLKYHTFIAGNELYIWAGDLQAVSALAELPAVDSLRLARSYPLDPIISTGQQPQATTAWGIADTKADQFWAQFGVQGDGIVVANIDTGVQWDHPALVNQYKCPSNPGRASCWYDPSNICGGTPCDNNGHGTHTMGTMVADDNASLTYIAGMAPNAQWIACKGCESDSCSDFALESCADWIVAPNQNPANRPHVVNNSWGGDGGVDWYLGKVNAWRAAGIFPAFSAGNSGSSCSTLGSPGDYQESFGSAAHDIYRSIAWFSSRGPSVFGHDPYTKPNISAPGVDICSTVPTDGWDCTYGGTSMASPHTAGAVALLWSCNPALVGQIDQTFQILQNTVDAPPAGSCGAPDDGQGNYTFGYGFLNVLQAGQLYCSTANPTPVPTSTYTPIPATATYTPVPTATFTRTPWPTAVPATPSAWVHLPIVARFATPTPTPVPTVPTSTPAPTVPTFTPAPTVPTFTPVPPTVTPTPTPVWKPKAGFWQEKPNAYSEFYVTADQDYVDGFAIYISVSGCGSYKITHLLQEPIINYYFSFSGSFYGSGTFSTRSKCSGIYGLSSFYIPGCGYVSGGPFSYNSVWKSAMAAEGDAGVGPVILERVAPDGDHSFLPLGLTALPFKR